MATLARLPGISFRTEVPAETDPLPRTDIAGLVGLADSGPLDTPVAVEDVTRFHDIFGKDVAVAWDPGRGETVYGQLGPAVRSFFRNGGRRCWIVRAARDAKTNVFPIPGLLRPAGRDFEAAWAVARSEGSWSDPLWVGTALEERLLPGGVLQELDEDEWCLDISAGPDPQIRPGALLKIHFEAAGVLAYLAVASAETIRRADSPGPRPGTLRVRLHPPGSWFRVVDWKSETADFERAAWLTVRRDDPKSVAVEFTDPQFEIADLEIPELRIRLDQEEGRGLQPGAWIRLDRAGSPPPYLLALAEAVHRGADDPSGSPAADRVRIEVIARNAWERLDGPLAWQANHSTPFRASLVAFELRVRFDEGRLVRLSRLATNPGHPRDWSLLPTDESLFTGLEEAASHPARELIREASHPRFPLAGPPEGSGDYVPLGIPFIARPDFEHPCAAPPAGESPQQRSGLASFDADLFLDPDLDSGTVTTLLAKAFHKMYQRPADRDRRLRKLHALLPIEEVGLLAAPDASLPAWGIPTPTESRVLPAPELLPILKANEEGGFDVSWTAVSGALAYDLEESDDPAFERARRQPEAEGTTVRLIRSSVCPATLYYRVRARAASAYSPWSNTVRHDFPRQDFEACSAVLWEPPSVRTSEDRGRWFFHWRVDVPDADRFRVEMSGDPAFGLVEILYEGPRRGTAPEEQVEFTTLPNHAIYLRARARRDGVEWSPWSLTGVIDPAGSAPGAPTVLPDPEEDGLPAGRHAVLRVHQALLRFCAARADAFAVLGLPRHYREKDASGYASELAALFAHEDPDEAPRALSFGALFHPTMRVYDDARPAASTVLRLPPEGSLLGVLAARTWEAGAWASPANRVLRGVLGLEEPPDTAARRRLQEARVNPVVGDPRGFMPFGDWTLSPDAALRGIGVRRLLILLRRLALREGQGMVFRPNDDAFRRHVRRHFETALGDLFRRGALAGRTHAEAYRVVTDESVNPRASLESGRFVVELWVAPSEPLTFLTVRLVQTGSDLRLSEEV